MNNLDEYHNPVIEDLHDSLVDSTYRAWDENGSDPSKLYGYARYHHLIAWDYRQKRWQAANLGRFILDLDPLSATVYLLTIDQMLHSSYGDTWYVATDQLLSLIEGSFAIDYLQQGLLVQMGLLRSEYEYERGDETALTPLGKIAAQRATNPDNSMRQVVTALIESEERGFTFMGSEDEVDSLLRILDGSSVDIRTRESAQTAVMLFRTGQYVDSARIMYPMVEAVTNQLLKLVGEDPNDRRKYHGLHSKTRKLTDLGWIPQDISEGFDITLARNKVVHGEFTPADQKVAFPTCIAAIMYFRRLLGYIDQLENRQ